MRRKKGTGTYVFDKERGVWTARVWVHLPGHRKQRKRVTGQTENELKRKLRDLIADAEAGKLLPSMKLSEWMKQWLREKEGQVADSTHRQYRHKINNAINPLLGHVSLKDLTPQMVEESYKNIEGGRAQQLFRNILRIALNDAKRHLLVDHNAAELARPPKHKQQREAQLVTREEFDRIMSFVEREELRLFFEFCYQTGARPHKEARTLTWEQITKDDEGWWFRPQSKTVAGESLRPIPTPLALNLSRSRPTTNTRAVFTLVRGTAIGTKHILDVWRSATKSASSSAKLYDLRHSFATRMAQKGVRDDVLKALMGHTDIATTKKHYVKKDLNEMQRAIR